MRGRTEKAGKAKGYARAEMGTRGFPPGTGLQARLAFGRHKDLGGVRTAARTAITCSPEITGRAPFTIIRPAAYVCLDLDLEGDEA